MKNASIIKGGLLVDSDSVPFWIAYSIQQLLGSGYGEISFILRTQPDIHSSQPNTRLREAAYRWYEKFDAKLKRAEPAFDSRVALSDLLPEIEILEIHQKSDIGEEKTHAPDILFNACVSKPDLNLCQLAVYGLWSFCDGNGHNDDVESNSIGCSPDGFIELTSGAPTTAVSLQMISPHPNHSDRYINNVISSSCHLPDILLLARQRQNVLMQAASQFPAAVERLTHIGGTQFKAEVAERPENQKNTLLKTGFDQHSYRNNCYPNNWQTCLQLLRHASRYVGRKIQKLLFFEQWCLLIHYNGNDEHSVELHKFTEIIPPDDRIWADPFVIADEAAGNLFHIFIEEMERGNSHGHISVLTVDAQGNYKAAVPILERPYHMSYPFIFEYQNDRYLIPETGDNHTIELYRCVEFPHKWEFVKNLMEGKFAVDTTLHFDQDDGRWWMFTTIRQNPHTNCLDELHLFYADSPLSSDWLPHQLNPVSRDVTTARPAGALFASNGDSDKRLIRPSQNGGYHYGWGINLNVVTRLDTERYEETTLRVLKPTWRRSVIATHTLNHANGMTVSDVRKLRWRWLARVRALLSR